MQVKVQPSFASNDVFVMPEGVRPASPSYLISCNSQTDRKVAVTIEHYVRVTTREEADELVLLQANPTPSEGDVYKYQEVSEGESEFIPGERKGRLTCTTGQLLKEKFLKIGSLESEDNIIVCILTLMLLSKLNCQRLQDPNEELLSITHPTHTLSESTDLLQRHLSIDCVLFFSASFTQFILRYST